MEGIARDEIVKLGDLEVWEFENQAGSGMGMMGSMSLPHPIHLHGLQFQVIERKISTEDANAGNPFEKVLLIKVGMILYWFFQVRR